MFFGLKNRHFKLIMHLDRSMVQGNIVAEDFRNRGFLKDRLPWTLRLTRTAVDAFIRMNIELVWELFSVVAHVFVNAVNRTDTHASCIETVSAKAGYGPRHL